MNSSIGIPARSEAQPLKKHRSDRSRQSPKSPHWRMPCLPTFVSQSFSPRGVNFAEVK